MRGRREVPDEAKRPVRMGPPAPPQDPAPRGHAGRISHAFASLSARHPLESAAGRPGAVRNTEAGEGVWHGGHRSD
jgi:hypothetical protein